MTILVTILSTGKDTWSEVAKLINNQDWDHIFVITNDFGKQTITKKENMTLVVINSNNSITSIRDTVIAELTDKIHDTEVAFNMHSGSGKEHMAVLSAILKLGVGIRLVTYTDSVNEI